MGGRAVVAGLLLLASGAAGGGAQTRLDPRLLPQADTATAAPGFAALASAIVPGTGQYLLGADRWVPYIALELWAWVSFLDRRGEAHEFAADYRDLAWNVARRVSVGERRDTVFDYYEALSSFGASGAFDADPRLTGVQPERDAATFNGDLWALARSLFFPGGVEFQPGSAPYERALAYYVARAVPASFAWAWGESNLEQQSFRELIRRSDEAYRSSTQLLGLVLVNHVVSAVDALVLRRIRERGAGRSLRVEGAVETAPGAPPRLYLQASIRW